MIRSNHTMNKAILLLAAVLVPAAPAFAGGGGAHGGPHGSIADLFWPWINFSLYLLVLWALLRKPFAKGWTARRQGIEQSVAVGAKELQEADRAVIFARSREQSVEADCKALRESISEDAKREGAQLIEEAKRRAEFVTRQAGETAQAEQRQ
ncbi:MAG: hypothetical protein EBZ48_04940, partial [Proteobacteria bacterium]|nr:hypothetical protein [Pseudomonadota bacterium]